MRFLVDWLDHRTGIRRLTREALFENIPGGSRWRYVWGSTLTFTILIQIVTGIALWMAYSPSSQTAWESVYYIQEEMSGGWILRGIHHYTAQLMTVLLVLHLMQVVIDGAYKAPREVNFWFGLLLLFIVMALSLTGYLLPWDQKGYWATKVATNLVGVTPVIGDQLQRLIVGGANYGHHTLTRFFALHAGVLPGLMMVLIVGHIFLFRRHGITPKEPRRRPDAAFWPDQVLKDAVACLAVLAAVMLLVVISHGAELTAPANPAENYSAARPDWYFMFLFQLLKYFKGEQFLWGAIYIPSILATILFLLPLIALIRFGRVQLGHFFALAFLWSCIFGFFVLTGISYFKDRKDPSYREAVAQAHEEAERVRVLAKAPAGIPAGGAIQLLREDPLTQGPKLFASKCASCHAYDGHDGRGHKRKDPQSASDLKGFASREWIRGLLDPEKIVSPRYFGGTRFADPPEGEKRSKMVTYVLDEVTQFSEQEKEALEKAIAALSAEAKLVSQREIDERDAALIEEGIAMIGEDGLDCTQCHAFRNDDARSRPDLTGYGSREWMIEFIANPGHNRFYGDRNDRMPAFRDKEILRDNEIGLVVDWLRGEWYEPGQEKE